MSITLQELLFVGEYLKDWNATQAVIRMGFTGKYPSQEGYRLKRQPSVRAEIERAREAVAKKVMIGAEDVLRDIVDVLTSDGRELAEQRLGSCRYCWGNHNQYQYKASEWETLEVDAFRKGEPSPDPRGGIGYLRKREPNPACPECEGEGEPYILTHDMRGWSPSAAALYEGIKPTANGIEVKMRSKDAAREAAARWLGMNKHTVDITVGKKAKDMTDDELAQYIADDDK